MPELSENSLVVISIHLKNCGNTTERGFSGRKRAEVIPVMSETKLCKYNNKQTDN